MITNCLCHFLFISVMKHKAYTHNTQQRKDVGVGGFLMFPTPTHFIGA